MSLKQFRAPVLPKPTLSYDPGYLRELVRVIGLYFSQLDSFTPNQADSYTARYYYIVNPGIVADLPTAADFKGARTFVTDGAAVPIFGAVAAGGGTLFLPVFSDGVDWRNG